MCLSGLLIYVSVCNDTLFELLLQLSVLLLQFVFGLSQDLQLPLKNVFLTHQLIHTGDQIVLHHIQSVPAASTAMQLSETKALYICVFLSFMSVRTELSILLNLQYKLLVCFLIWMSYKKKNSPHRYEICTSIA